MPAVWPIAPGPQACTAGHCTNTVGKRNTMVSSCVSKRRKATVKLRYKIERHTWTGHSPRTETAGPEAALGVSEGVGSGCDGLGRL